MRIKLSCLACGHSMDLGDAYQDYEGEVRCWVCHAVLEVTLHEGQLRSMKKSTGATASGPVETETSAPRPSALDRILLSADREAR